MKKWKDHWRELLPYEKLFAVAGWLFLGAAMITLFLDIIRESDVVRAASGASMAAALACQAVCCWRRERSRAWMYMVCAILLTLTTVMRVVILFA